MRGRIRGGGSDGDARPVRDGLEGTYHETERRTESEGRERERVRERQREKDGCEYIWSRSSGFPQRQRNRSDGAKETKRDRRPKGRRFDSVSWIRFEGGERSVRITGW